MLHINKVKQIIDRLIDDKQPIAWRGGSAVIVEVSYPSESADEVWLRLEAKGTSQAIVLTIDQLTTLALNQVENKMTCLKKKDMDHWDSIIKKCEDSFYKNNSDNLDDDGSVVD